MKGHSQKVVSSNIKEMVKSGYKPKQAIAASLASSRKYKKMAAGGMVHEGEYEDLDAEHERGLFDLMAEGDQPPVANPGVNEMQQALAKKLQKMDMERDPYAEGGYVGMHGDGELPDDSSQSQRKQVQDSYQSSMDEGIGTKLKRAFGYAGGGLVEGMDGDEEPEVMMDGTEEPMSSQPMKPQSLGHSVIDGVPEVSPKGLSEEAIRALKEKKAKRKFKGITY